MSPEEFKKRRQKARLSQLDLAKMIGIEDSMSIELIENGIGRASIMIEANRAMNKVIEAKEDEEIAILKETLPDHVKIDCDGRYYGVVFIRSDFKYFELEYKKSLDTRFCAKAKGYICRGNKNGYMKELDDVIKILDVLNDSII